LAKEVVAEAAPQLSGLGLDASLGVLMRSAQERLCVAGAGRKRARVGPSLKNPGGIGLNNPDSVSLTPTHSVS
jgi:hypothetical protein